MSDTRKERRRLQRERMDALLCSELGTTDARLFPVRAVGSAAILATLVTYTSPIYHVDIEAVYDMGRGPHGYREQYVDCYYVRVWTSDADGIVMDEYIQSTLESPCDSKTTLRGYVLEQYWDIFEGVQLYRQLHQ